MAKMMIRRVSVNQPINNSTCFSPILYNDMQQTCEVYVCLSFKLRKANTQNPLDAHLLLFTLRKCNQTTRDYHRVLTQIKHSQVDVSFAIRLLLNFTIMSDEDHSTSPQWALILQFQHVTLHLWWSYWWTPNHLHLCTFWVQNDSRI